MMLYIYEEITCILILECYLDYYISHILTTIITSLTDDVRKAIMHLFPRKSDCRHEFQSQQTDNYFDVFFLHVLNVLPFLLMLFATNRPMSFTIISHCLENKKYNDVCFMISKHSHHHLSKTLNTLICCSSVFKT